MQILLPFPCTSLLCSNNVVVIVFKYFHILKACCHMFRQENLGDWIEAKHISGLVSSSEFRSFWISWENDIISYGKGDEPGVNSLLSLSYRDPDLCKVDIMRISSYANEEGDWRIPADLCSGMCMCVCEIQRWVTNQFAN